MAPRSRNVTPPPRRGRPKLYAEQIRVPLAAGMTAAIDAVRRDDEDRLSLIRAAIEREIKRRQKDIRSTGNG